MSSASPRRPRSACEIALAETPASRASSPWLRWRWMRTARSAAPSRAAVGAGSSACPSPSVRTWNTLPCTPCGRPSAFAIRSRPARQDDDALGRGVDRLAQLRGMAPGRERPVADRPEAEQQRTRAREEPLRDAVPPAIAQRIQRVEHHQRPRRSLEPLAHGDQQLAGVRDRIAPHPPAHRGRRRRDRSLGAARGRPRASRTATLLNCSRARISAVTNGASDEPPSSSSQTTLSPQKRPPRAASSSVTPVDAVSRTRAALVARRPAARRRAAGAVRVGARPGQRAAVDDQVLVADRACRRTSTPGSPGCRPRSGPARTATSPRCAGSCRGAASSATGGPAGAGCGYQTSPA